MRATAMALDHSDYYNPPRMERTVPAADDTASAADALPCTGQQTAHDAREHIVFREISSAP